MIRVLSVFASAALFISLVGCGGDEDVEPGTLTAEVACTDYDSLLTTVYMADGEMAGASQWCACGTEGCSVEFDGLGYGNYVLGISNPDSLYLRTEGAEGFAQTLGYYSEGGLHQEADTITLSQERPSANIQVDVTAGLFRGEAESDTLDGAAEDTLGGTAADTALAE